MSENLQKLREAGIAHPTHDFDEKDIKHIDTLTEDEVNAVISAKEKLAHVAHKKHEEDDETHPDTMVV
ncbi:MAG: hypothetical protein ACR2NP_03595 [Pirellulaceae bacterium]